MARVVVPVLGDPGRHLPGHIALADTGLDEDPLGIDGAEPDHFAGRGDEGFSGAGTNSRARFDHPFLLPEANVAGHQGSANEGHPAQRAAALIVRLVVPVHRAEPDRVGVAGARRFRLGRGSTGGRTD